MAAQPTPHRTPLRRHSQGSLFRLSRSAQPDTPHGLGFLAPALGELADETETLHANVQGLKNLSSALERFNESFASWLYVMNMNSLTVDWPQAPNDASFELAARRAEDDALAALEAARQARQPTPPPPPPTDPNQTAPDTTFAGDITALTNASAAPSTSSQQPKGIMKKKPGGKAKMTAKEKKERAAVVDKVVNALPLEFRGSDPTLRTHVELVVGGLLDREGRGVGLLELVKPPDLNNARVNKCLIALVNRKVVKKDNSTGSVLYHWQGLPS